jgi:hypothetical protein
MTIHLPWGGSSAHRDIPCPGNIKKSENLPRRPTNAAAIEGSMHHEVMEKCQTDGTKPDAHVGLIYKEDDGQTQTFTEDDLDLSWIAYNATNELLDELDIDEIIIEPFVQFIPGKSGGSIDLLGLSEDRKTLLIGDYKFGQVKVSPKESAQCGCYGISARVDPATADMFKQVEKIVFAIIQPRVKGVVSLWETDTKWLDKFEKTYLAAMEKDHLSPGSHCKYCTAEPYCETRRAQVMASNLLGARDQKELSAAAEMVNEVEAWCKSIREELYLQMCRGVPIPGWKIVEKRHTRKWADEGHIESDLNFAGLKMDDIFKHTILTPPQMEKMLKKKKVEFDLDEFIVSKSSGNTIATEDDSRDAVLVSDIQGDLAEMMK